MKVDYKESFLRDLRRINDNAVKERLRTAIDMVKQAEDLKQISNVKKLVSGAGHYRIRIGDYRLGFTLEGETIIFVRFLHRKDLYRYFP